MNREFFNLSCFDPFKIHLENSETGGELVFAYHCGNVRAIGFGFKKQHGSTHNIFNIDHVLVWVL